MAEVAVELSEVTKRYGDVVAVDRLSLQVSDGEFFALLGPSGCGKTTTLRMVAGLELPSEGTLKINGVEMGQRPAFQRPVNTVFQSYALFPHMTVAENIAFGLRMKRVPPSEIEARVQEALRMVRLEGYGARRPRQLSGGQQQRVALARALINRPEVLLLDEPLGALDLQLRKEMQFELKRLQQQVGITFIFVTHDQEEALVLSDRIGVMHGGRLLQIGTPTEIYERPTLRFVADFIGEANFLDGTLAPNGQGSGSETTSSVQLAGGITVQGQMAFPGQPQQAVTLSVRPEKIRISDEPLLSTVNTFPVHVSAIAYVGSDTRIRVRLPNGQELDIWEQNDRSTLDKNAYYAPGDQAWVFWDPLNALILAE